MTSKLEVCIDSISGLEACVNGNADRIELCSSFELGGLTPSDELMKLASEVNIPCRVMIRPKKGSFECSSKNLHLMFRDIDKARAYNLDGVVFGVTLLNGELDQEFLDELIRHSDGFKKTLHRAVDTIPKTIEAVEIAINLGFDMILSSGGYETAMEGLAVLKAMQQRASGRIEIMPGSGINPQNISEILSDCDFAWLHSSCSIRRQNNKITDSQTIKDIKNAINL
jgi:copper homeostasis protein